MIQVPVEHSNLILEHDPAAELVAGEDPASSASMGSLLESYGFGTNEEERKLPSSEAPSKSGYSPVRRKPSKPGASAR